MRIVREEIFGPVLAVQPFGGEADAVTLANDSLYGLNAMVFTTDLGRVPGRRHCPGELLVRARSGSSVRWDEGLRHRARGGAYSRDVFTEPKAVVMQL